MTRKHTVDVLHQGADLLGEGPSGTTGTTSSIAWTASPAPLVTEIGVSNGMAWDTAGTTLCFIDRLEVATAAGLVGRRRVLDSTPIYDAVAAC